MSPLAAQGHRVLFVENTGVRAPRARDLPRVRQRIRNSWRGTKGFRQERPNLFVYSPLLLPPPYSRAARAINRFLLAVRPSPSGSAPRLSSPIAPASLSAPPRLRLIPSTEPLPALYY